MRAGVSLGELASGACAATIINCQHRCEVCASPYDHQPQFQIRALIEWHARTDGHQQLGLGSFHTYFRFGYEPMMPGIGR